MYDYSEQLKEFSKSVLYTKSRIVKEHGCHYPTLEMLLGFHYWLHNQIDPAYREQKKEWYSAPRLIHVLFMNNFSVAHSVLQAFESNSLMVTGPLLRNMLETVVKMEYLASRPSELDNMIYADAVKGVGTEEKEEKTAEVHKDIAEEERCNSEEGCNCIQAILKQIKDRYSFKWYLQKLYPNQNTPLRKYYNYLSQLTHSNMNKMNQQVAWMHSHNSDTIPQHSKSPNLFYSDISNYKYEISDRVLRSLTWLLFCNITAELRGNKNMIAKGGFLYEVMPFLDKLHGVFPDREDQKSIDETIRVIKNQ